MCQEPRDAPFPPCEDEDQRQGSTTMPTLADIRRQVRDKVTALLGLEVSEDTLIACCSVLAILVISPSKARIRLMCLDPRLKYLDVAVCDDILEDLADSFAEELALLEAACRRLDQEAAAR